MAIRMGAAARSRLAASVAVALAVALLGIPGDSVTNTAAGPNLAVGDAGASEEAVASQAARSLGKPVQVRGLTSETTEVWALPDGQFRAQVSAGAVRVRRGDGWVPVDLTLRRAVDGSVAPVAHPSDLRISGARSAGVHVLASVGLGDDRLSVGWSGALPEPSLTGNRATYVDALPGVDLVVKATRVGMETFFVVKSRAAASRVAKVSLPIIGKNLAGFSRDAGGNMAFKDSAGRVYARTPAPEMWDAQVDVLGQPASQMVVATQVATTSTGAPVELTLTPDAAWLTDPARRYPVTIDPQINPLSTTFDTYVKEGDTAENGGANDLQLGNVSGKVTRSLARWNTTALAGKQITSATVYFWNWWSQSCAAKSWEIWTVGTVIEGVLWGDQPAWNYKEASTTATKGYDSTCGDGWVSISGTDFFQRAADVGDTRADMGIRATSETDVYYFKQFRSRNAADPAQVPYAVVNYNSYPTVTARSTAPASMCATGVDRPLVNSLTPQLQATVSDADGQAMSVTFEWWAVGATAPLGSATVSNVASGATAAKAVPAGAFIDGGAYQWRVKAWDGVAGSDSWTSFCEMTVWITAPPVQGCTGGVDSDFNGDGVADVAIADPEATVNGLEKAGQIHVVYGGTGAVYTLYEDNAKVTSQTEAGDQFGHTVSAYDANRDGCTDLAVGVPFEDIGTTVDAGLVYVLLGSPAGLAQGPNSLTWHQDSTNVPDSVEAGDWFGFSVAASSTASGEPYLVIGVPGEDIGAGADTGLAHYIRGSVNVAMSQGGGGIPGSAEIDDRTGYAVAASTHHFAVSSPGEAIVAEVFAGAVNVFSHQMTSGLPTLAAGLTQDSSGVSEVSEANDDFGKSISLAAYRPVGAAAGTAESFLAVGVPGEDIGSFSDAGLVQRFHIKTTGYTELPAVAQSTPGISGGDEDGDYFGEHVLVVNTDPAAEASPQTLLLAVGSPGEDLVSTADAGTVRVFAAAANPIASDVTVERGAASLPGAAIGQEFIGTALGGTSQYLYVGSPYGDAAVFGFSWSGVAAGSAAVTQTWKPGLGGLPVEEIAFGAVIG